MKKLVVDLDEVLCKDGFLYILNEYLDTSYKIEEFTSYYIDDIIGNQKEKDLFYEHLKTKNIYDNATLIEDAYESIALLNHKYDLFICSDFVMNITPTTIASSGLFVKHKYEYLLKTFPFLNPRKIIFTGDKTILNCDIKIDDRIKHFSTNTPLNLLFHSYHNKDITNKELEQKNAKRVHSWNQIKELLL